MNIKLALAGALIAAFVTPALAEDRYYVVRDNDTKKCSVVKEKPTTNKVTQIGGGDSYKTEADAMAVIKGATDCAANQ